MRCWSATSSTIRHILILLFCTIPLVQWEIKKSSGMMLSYIFDNDAVGVVSTTTSDSKIANSTLMEEDHSDNADDLQRAFQLASARARRRSETLFDNLFQLSEVSTKSSSNNSSPLYNSSSLWPYRPLHRSKDGKLLNMLRIPKAGSSALSITARALIGCAPDGFPCCQNTTKPSRITKACPRGDLHCPAIRGCIDHKGEYADDDPLTITMIRHPVARALSAFFYVPPHRPRGACRTMQCFQHQFLQQDQYRNPMTKMLSGYHAYYSSLPTSIVIDPETAQQPISIQRAKSRLCSMSWFGLVEMPIASALILYETHPFDQLVPNPVVFGLPPQVAAPTYYLASIDDKTEIHHHHEQEANNKNSSTLNLTRKNPKEIYKQFKSTVFVQQNGTQLVQQYHDMDMAVYDFAVDLFCRRLFAAHENHVKGGTNNNEPLFYAATRTGLAKHFAKCQEIIEQRADNKTINGGPVVSSDLCSAFLVADTD
jgi:hypothetical protein